MHKCIISDRLDTTVTHMLEISPNSFLLGSIFKRGRIEESTASI